MSSATEQPLDIVTDPAPAVKKPKTPVSSKSRAQKDVASEDHRVAAADSATKRKAHAEDGDSQLEPKARKFTIMDLAEMGECSVYHLRVCASEGKWYGFASGFLVSTDQDTACARARDEAMRCFSRTSAEVVSVRATVVGALRDLGKKNAADQSRMKAKHFRDEDEGGDDENEDDGYGYVYVHLERNGGADQDLEVTDLSEVVDCIQAHVAASISCTRESRIKNGDGFLVSTDSVNGAAKIVFAKENE